MLIVPFHAIAQKILLEENIKRDYMHLFAVDEHDVNKHLYLGAGIIAGAITGDGLPIDYNSSHTFIAGFRNDRIVAGFYSIGYNICFTNLSFAIKQDSLKKTIPNAILHDAEKLKFNNVGIDVFQRIYIRRKGERIGTFFDTGIYGNWAFNIKHQIKDHYKTVNQNNAHIAKIIYKRLNYIEQFSYGVRARIGYHRYAIAVDYRISDFFNEIYHNEILDVELPRFTIAFQIGLHK